MASRHLDLSNIQTQKNEVHDFKDISDLKRDNYLAPEFFYGRHHTSAVDNWSLGNFIFFVIFGENPSSIWDEMGHDKLPKFVNQPSDYNYYRIFNDKLLNDIIKFDYNMEPEATSCLQRAIGSKSFTGGIKQLLTNMNILEYLEDPNVQQDISNSRLKESQDKVNKMKKDSRIVQFKSEILNTEDDLWKSKNLDNKSSLVKSEYLGQSSNLDSKIQMKDVLNKSKNTSILKNKNDVFNIGFVMDIIATL